MKVPFLDLSFTTGLIKKDYLLEVNEFLDRNQFILTQEVSDFENAWAKYVDVRYCIGVSSGSDALYLALVACGINSGDEVIIQGNAYNACVTAIIHAGGVPRFVDIDSESLCLDTSKITPLINSKTKAIMPVHLYGQACPMDEIMDIAKKHNLRVVEDCAQAHGAVYKDKHVGSFGDAGAFSFYPTKNLGAFGDAGAVVTDDEQIFTKIIALRNLGQISKNDHRYFGLNMRLDSIHAIALKLKLKKFQEVTEFRKKAGEYYEKLFREMNLQVKTLKTNSYSTNVYHLYVIWNYGMDRDKLRKKLIERGVETAIHYPVPVYNQPFYQEQKKDPCPVTNRVLNEIVSLPMFYGITTEQQHYVVETLASILHA
ncbi:MAG: Glutamine-scyllo-inositol transaminase [Parcubacteria group bacterium GW2011_GWB2_40_8]|nr:MAG: Glutamine-scyllo-inositol transaminase [Parcubacteria group bacterium GW2011_GWB2_40_8]OHE41547.1 MAG: hypothetical protein A2102_01785 [Tenericutes bacterium GWF2_38_8]